MPSTLSASGGLRSPTAVEDLHHSGGPVAPSQPALTAPPLWAAFHPTRDRWAAADDSGVLVTVAALRDALRATQLLLRATTDPPTSTMRDLRRFAGYLLLNRTRRCLCEPTDAAAAGGDAGNTAIDDAVEPPTFDVRNHASYAALRVPMPADATAALALRAAEESASVQRATRQIFEMLAVPPAPLVDVARPRTSGGGTTVDFPTARQPLESRRPGEEIKKGSASGGSPIGHRVFEAAEGSANVVRRPAFVRFAAALVESIGGDAIAGPTVPDQQRAAAAAAAAASTAGDPSVEGAAALGHEAHALDRFTTVDYAAVFNGICVADAVAAAEWHALRASNGVGRDVFARWFHRVATDWCAVGWAFALPLQEALAAFCVDVALPAAAVASGRGPAAHSRRCNRLPRVAVQQAAAGAALVPSRSAASDVAGALAVAAVVVPAMPLGQPLPTAAQVGRQRGPLSTAARRDPAWIRQQRQRLGGNMFGAVPFQLAAAGVRLGQSPTRLSTPSARSVHVADVFPLRPRTGQAK